VLGDTAALTRLERIMHPLVRAAERRFLARARRDGKRVAVLDIPLLFETGAAGRVDRVIVVSAPAAVQRARVRARGSMAERDIDAVLARQMPDRERRRRADDVIATGLSRFHALRSLKRLMKTL
jgi:dephospho-CoA kinase